MCRQLAKVLVIAGTIAAGFLGQAAAQDTHYWTLQYGTRSELLGGAVVGSPQDLSATYYNPGALSLLDDPSVILSAQAYEYRRIKLEGGAGEGFTKSNFDPVPTLLAGLLPSKWLTGTLAYSVLTRQNFDLRVTAAGVASQDVIARNPGPEIFAGASLFDQKLNEMWGGLTWSHRVREDVGVGVTWYGAYRGQRTRSHVTAQVVVPNGDGATATTTREFDYSHYRMLWKLGIAWNASPLTIGGALTTPSIGLFGGGSVFSSLFFTGLDTDGDNAVESGIAADFQEDLSTNYKTPLSVAIGGAYQFDRGAVYVSAEWFDKIDNFVVVDGKDFQPQTSGPTVSTRVTRESDQVINVGIGGEYRVRENLSYYGSFFTDFSSDVPGSETNDTITNWDIYHVTSGAAVLVKGREFTLGLQYAFGSEKAKQSVDFSGARESNLLIGDPGDFEVRFSKWKFIVGFAFSI